MIYHSKILFLLTTSSVKHFFSISVTVSDVGLFEKQRQFLKVLALVIKNVSGTVTHYQLPKDLIYQKSCNSAVCCSLLIYFYFYFFIFYFFIFFLMLDLVVFPFTLLGLVLSRILRNHMYFNTYQVSSRSIPDKICFIPAGESSQIKFL